MKMMNARPWVVTIGSGAILVASAVAVHAGPPKDPVGRCASDAVVVGSGCMDRYEASVWRIPDPLNTNKKLAKKVRKGAATVADLVTAGAMQLGTTADNYAPCNDQGQNCANDIFAVSLPGVTPSRFITWFQAQEACTNSGKRLPSNAEWQAAANGTPDPGLDNGTTDCNSASTTLSVTPTGSRSNCVSARGAYDMVGNVWEWVADWMPLSTDCPGWGAFSNDFMCLAGASTTDTGPAALLRGGSYLFGATAGPLAIGGLTQPSGEADDVGFRCMR